MEYSDQERLIALAGLHQTAFCVQKIAQHGEVDAEIFEPCVYSIFQLDAPSVAAVYGTPSAVIPGARKMITQITGQPERDLDITRYVVTLLRHERLLASHAETLDDIRNAIEIVALKRQSRPLLDNEVIFNLATIYSEHISHLEPRILVRGNPQHLKNIDHQHSIRTLLLAGIRSAMLWRQIGGRRRHLIFGRKRLLEHAFLYLNSYSEPETA